MTNKLTSAWRTRPKRKIVKQAVLWLVYACGCRSHMEPPGSEKATRTYLLKAENLYCESCREDFRKQRQRNLDYFGRVYGGI